MKLEQLIKPLGASGVRGGETEITRLAFNCNQPLEGALYFCFKGGSYDGHDFAAKAIENGAAAFVCERSLDTALPQVVVSDARAAMGLVAAEFYGRPSDRLTLIGVTGTNGKTTTCEYIYSILKAAGRNAGIIGTPGARFGNSVYAPSLTTPDPVFLHSLFAEMVESGVDTVVMEVSAHAVAQRKISGLKFKVGVFTNLSRDHLDFFGTMENYGAAKAAFLTSEYCEYVVVNADDRLSATLNGGGAKLFGYGIDNPSDVFALDVDERSDGTGYILNLFDRIGQVDLKMRGGYNVYNSLAAAAACAAVGVGIDAVERGLAALKGVSGRIERVAEYNGGEVYVDFAHTPDGLERVLKALRAACRGRLICLFGCGGNRDATKRPIMGKIAATYADYTVLTSDNPRYEEPCAIMFEVERGIVEVSREYIAIQNRRTAIEYALCNLSKGDLLLLAGKGAEEYQEIMGVKHAFGDAQAVREIIARLERDRGGHKD